MSAAVAVALISLSCGGGSLNPFGSCEEACAEDGLCGRRTWAAGDGFYRCFPRSDADCEQSRACRDEGRCDYRPERQLEACVAADEASCLASTECRDEGRCRPDHAGRCVANEAGCVASRACAEQDRCEAYDDRCLVPKGDGPRCEKACRVEGACTEEGGRCKATSDDDCRASHLCGQFGACTLGPAESCLAGTDADCEASKMCEWNGLCRATEGVCTEGLAPCEDACRMQGWCGLTDAVCVPRTDADCAASLACLVTGACSRSGGSRTLCSPLSDQDCASSLDGVAFGRTVLRSGRTCVSPSDPPTFWPVSTCSWDPACAEEGRCLTANDRSCHSPEEFGLPPIPPDRLPRVRRPR